MFEASKKESNEALKTFLRNGLKNSSVTCILAGQYTAARRWIRYEIVSSVLKSNGLLTVDIHGVKNKEKKLGVKGTNPLDEVGVYLTNSKIYFAERKNGQWVTYSDYTSAFPASDLWFDASTSTGVVKLSKHCKRYDFAAQNGRENIADWIENAANLVGR